MIQFTPIGIVRNAIDEAHRDTRWEEIESEIVIDERWRDALDGIEQFSHIWVVFVFDQMSAPDSLKIRPMQKDDMPIVGIFATRSPQRPNPIGIRAAELVGVQDNILRVRGLDALNDSPVLDLKPYLPRGDAIQGARVGEWVQKYWATLPAENK